MNRHEVVGMSCGVVGITIAKLPQIYELMPTTS